jgi:hypothetical protein
MTDEEIENRLRWTAAASEHATLQRVVELAFDRAAAAYRRGDDATATYVRQLARDIDLLRADAEKRLQVFIDAAINERTGKQ